MLTTIGIALACLLVVGALIHLFVWTLRRARGAVTWRMALAICFGVGVSGAAGWIGYHVLLPCGGSVCQLEDGMEQLRRRTVVVDRHGRSFGVLEPALGDWAPLASLPPYVPGAIIAAEDRRFYGHAGADFLGIGRAIVRNLSGHHHEGASTLAFQTAQLALGPANRAQLPKDGTWAGKLAEMSIGWRLIDQYGHHRVLESYVNNVPLGGVNGVPAAARYYFGREASTLTPGQAATLAAMIRAPSRLDPRDHRDVARKERDRVLEIMADLGQLSVSELTRAKAEPVRTARTTRRTGEDFLRYLRTRDSEIRGLSVRDTLWTTLDLTREQEAERELMRGIKAVEGGAFGSAGRGSRLQAVYVAVNAQGEVLAYIPRRPDQGAADYDRIALGKVRLASTIKPVLLGTALELGLVRLDETIAEVEKRCRPPLGSAWARKLRRNSHLGDTVEEGIARSDNWLAYLLYELIPAERLRALEAAGLPSASPVSPGEALGLRVIKPISLVLAYASFVNGGYRVSPRVTAAPGPLAPVRLWNTTTTEDVSRAMRAVFTDGTGKQAAAILGTLEDAGLKTGTTEGNREFVLVGFRRSDRDTVISLVWLGHDRPRQIAPRGAAGSVLGPIWARIEMTMRDLEQAAPDYERDRLVRLTASTQR